MNVDHIREGFPFLDRKYNGKHLAYLDNASTTQKPQIVLDALVDTYKYHYANIHRGVYDLSIEATNLYEGVRERTAKFIGAKSKNEIIFTKNTTEAINLLAYVQGESLTESDEILLTQMEHHSNIVPWQLLAERLKANAKRQIKIKYIPITGDGRLDLSSLEKLVTKKTKIVSLTLMSNVLGTVNPIKEIISKIHKLFTIYHLSVPLVIVDAAQAVAHMRVDVGDLGCDFLAFSAHKMYGPAGVGVLWGRKDLLNRMSPFMGGGDMILSVNWKSSVFNEVPYKFEAGTPSIADVIAFGKAIEFVGELSFKQIKKHEMELTVYALKRLSEIPEVTIYGPHKARSRSDVSRAGVISFNVDNVHPHDVASILSEEGVAIRSGHHCAQPLMKVLGINAACRVSFGVYNTFDEIQRLVDGINRVGEVFGLKNKSTVNGLQSTGGVNS